MTEITRFGLIAFGLISFLFFIIRKPPILFHLTCAAIIATFVLFTGRSLGVDDIAEWVLMTSGLILYWFGLVIVRIMLTRSVSLRMLSNYRTGVTETGTREGIGTRLKDARTFGLVVASDGDYRLTLFGRVIGWIVAATYFLLRLK